MTTVGILAILKVDYFIKKEAVSMSMSINGFMSNYTYSYSMALRPKIDRNNDSRWSHAELEQYTSAYNKATGSALDAQKILGVYDADGDGFLDTKEQDAAYKEDALGLSRLTSLEEEAAAGSGANITQSLTDLMGKMSESGKMAMSRMVTRYEQSQTLLDNFMSSGSVFDHFSSLLQQQSLGRLQNMQMRYGSAGEWTAYAGQMLNALV